MIAESDLLQDSLEMVAKVVSLGPLDGYGILLRIEPKLDRRLRIEQGSLYLALSRLELEGSIASERGQSEDNRKAKYDRLTAAGRRQETEKWNRMIAVVGAILCATVEEA